MLERIEVLKLAFHWKLIESPNESYLHKWANSPNAKKYNLFKIYQQIKHKIIPNYQKIKGNIIIDVDPYDEFLNTKELRHRVVRNQHQLILNRLNKYHPLKIKKFLLSDYKCHPLYEEDELQPFVTNKMIIQYRELFCNFNKLRKYCNVCSLWVDMPLETYNCILSQTK